MSDLPELLPCPFCGAEQKVVSGIVNEWAEPEDRHPEIVWFLDHVCVSDEVYKSKESAIAAWNRRVKDE